MKTAISFLLLAVSACQSGPDNDPGPAANIDSFYSKCQFDNTACYGKESVGTQIVLDANGKPRYDIILVMSANADNTKSLWVVIRLDKFTGKGDYNLSTTNTEVYVATRAATTDYQSSKHTGTLKISEYTPKKLLTGTFTLTTSDGKQTKELKDGQFRSSSDF